MPFLTVSGTGTGISLTRSRTGLLVAGGFLSLVFLRWGPFGPRSCGVGGVAPLGVLFCLWLCVGRWPFLGPGSLLFVCSFGSVDSSESYIILRFRLLVLFKIFDF